MSIWSCFGVATAVTCVIITGDSSFSFTWRLHDGCRTAKSKQVYYQKCCKIMRLGNTHWHQYPNSHTHKTDQHEGVQESHL